MSDIVEYSVDTFDSIKHVNEEGQEFWYARELQKVLDYAEWRNLNGVIDKARIACEQSGNLVLDHFVNVNKMVRAGVADKEINDIMLSRYACYLVVMNGDPRKEIIALGQTYFAVKTRQQEVIENYDSFSEAQKRLAIRNEIVKNNITDKVLSTLPIYSQKEIKKQYHSNNLLLNYNILEKIVIKYKKRS